MQLLAKGPRNITMFAIPDAIYLERTRKYTDLVIPDASSWQRTRKYIEICYLIQAKYMLQPALKQPRSDGFCNVTDECLTERLFVACLQLRRRAPLQDTNPDDFQPKH